MIAADLAAIRGLDPQLDDVHIECEIPYGYVAGSVNPGGIDVIDAVWRGEFRAWDCHNAWYGIEHQPFGEGGDVRRVDGQAFTVRVEAGFRGTSGGRRSRISSAAG